MIQFDEDKQKQKLSTLHIQQEEDFAKIAAENRGVGYMNLTAAPIDLDALRLIPESIAKEASVVAFSMLDKRLGVATDTPDNENTKAAIKDLENRGYMVTLFLISSNSLAKTLERYKELSMATKTKAGSFDISNEQISNLLEKIKNVSDVKKLITEVLGEKQTYKVTRLVEIILAGALATDASDIHLEPEEDSVRLRYRLDGVLNDVLDIDNNTYAYILSRIKLISGLKLNIRTEAQDGRFSIKVKAGEMEVRTSTLPGANIESVVMRILNPNTIAVSMEQLGIEPQLLKIIEHELSKPTGMILNTGPTGSGKTTTLYAFLKKVYHPDVKVITIEDPVEYRLPGIVQTQANAEKGYTFASGLRAALRQDPDIIMVGEVRDSETATVAVNAALTGHLVFSTLHTNSAAGAFPRLLSLGVNPKVVTSAINVAMAQRLVRKLCQFCKKESRLEGEEKRAVDEIMSSISATAYKDIQRDKVWKAVGCDKCNLTGYKGRIGIFEAILAHQEIERIVTENPSEREIKEAAKKQNILDMRQDGIIKVLKAITSIDELRRVIDLEEKL